LIHYEAEEEPDMKWLQWMSKMFVVTLFATVISIVTTWLMVDLYAEQILKEFKLEDVRSQVQLLDVLAHLSEKAEGKDVQLPTDSSEAEETRSDGCGDSDQDRDGTGSGSLTGQGDAVAVWGQAMNLNELVISADEFNQVKDELSGEDKIKIFSILSSQMTDDLMMKLSVMLEGGLTRGELIELEQLMKELLNEEQFNEIMSIFSPFIDL